MDVLQSLQQGAEQGASAFFGYAPQLVGAVGILIVGCVVAKILQAGVTRFLGEIGFEHRMERGGVSRFFDRADTLQTPTSVLGKLVFWFVFVLAIVVVTEALGASQFSPALDRPVSYIPGAISAVLVLILASLLVNSVANLLRGATGVDGLANAAQAAVIVYAIFAASTQLLGMEPQITVSTFLVVLGAVALATVVFWLGGRGAAWDVARRDYYRHHENHEAVRAPTAREGGGSPSVAADRRFTEGCDLVRATQGVLARGVRDRGGREIGTVQDLYVDREGATVRFLVVSADVAPGLDGRRYLIPLETVVSINTDQVTLNQDRDKVSDSPSFEQEVAPDRPYQVALYRYYGCLWAQADRAAEHAAS